ncbi:hypothetical protein OAM77_02660 [Alphaproteobacteria bacterium]|nr:hypothetical protein [Alphaproteobacteria bacterium]MDC0461411.1 hypothetical protein [Alphaproteobacteria bacterium]
MKNIIMAAILLLLPATAFANGHTNIWNMAGLGTVTGMLSTGQQMYHVVAAD